MIKAWDVNTVKKVSDSAERQAKMGEIRPLYLESLHLVERLHRRLLDVIKDEFDRRSRSDINAVQALRRMGLARGGSLENAVVIEGDAILNPEGLRRPDEFVRHKALDAVGDLYVLGRPLLARFEGERAGHGINNAVVRALLAQPQAWRLVALEAELAEAV